jgi:hypothetical protein
LASRIIVSPSCKAHKVDSCLCVISRTRRLSFRFVWGIGGASFCVRSGLGRLARCSGFWGCFLLRSTISNDVYNGYDALTDLWSNSQLSNRPLSRVVRYPCPCINGKRAHSLLAAYQGPSLKVSRSGVLLPFVMGYQTEGTHRRAFDGASACDCVSSPPS